MELIEIIKWAAAIFFGVAALGFASYVMARMGVRGMLDGLAQRGREHNDGIDKG